MKQFTTLFICSLGCLTASPILHATDNSPYEISAVQAVDKNYKIIPMGTPTNPSGTTVQCNEKGFLINGVPTIPVMGEFHYSRYSPDEWEREILKMKAGGVNILATYVFWIHHEEIQGHIDWSGSNNLAQFLDICKKVGMPVILRMGPFAHGEVRGGGLPDWVVNSGCNLRSTDPRFMEYTTKWFSELIAQLRGRLWKEGGPIIGAQFDNEFGGPWEYLKALKDTASSMGFDVPIYTRTAWPGLSTPATYGEMLPMYGDYSDGFWDRSLTDMPSEYPNAYLFKEEKIANVIATEQFSSNNSAGEASYPYFTCELGGGMMTSYHRRILIEPKDVYAMSIVKIGSGSNLPGYYMYHGGTNPLGQLTTLNETQSTPYMNYNDLPVINYDFQAPLGQYGQPNEQYFWLRRTHMFLADFGSDFFYMDLSLPKDTITDARTDSRLRYSLRSNGTSGYLFVNNYQRLRQLPAHHNSQFKVNLGAESITFPHTPVTIPSGASFFMPVNMNLADATLRYATAQPFARIESDSISTFYFAEIKDLPISFEISGVNGSNDAVCYENVAPNPIQQFDFNTATGKIRLIFVDEPTSLRAYKYNNRIVFEDGVLYNHDGNLYSETWVNTGKNAEFTLTKEPSGKRRIELGGQNAAQLPSAEDVEQYAYTWNLTLPDDLTDADDCFLSINYEGDVACMFADGQLIQDNFYNGRDMLVPVKQLRGKAITLKILPAWKDDPIYFQEDVRKRFETTEKLISLKAIPIIKRQTTRLSE
jgi:hypothetical protein